MAEIINELNVKGSDGNYTKYPFGCNAENIKMQDGSSLAETINLVQADLRSCAPLMSPIFTGTPAAPTAATGTNTTQIATTAFVQQELEDVKKSVSDGKTTVANAITAKGVTTATDATFATMASNIAAIETGGGASGLSLNVFTQETEPETKEGIWVETANPHRSVAVGNKTYANASGPGEWISASTLPYEFYYSSAVVLNGEIHILGTFNSSYAKYHYKWDGSSLTQVSTLPYEFYYGSAVVLNGEIHILGGGNSSITRKNHYKWDGSSWSKVSTLPYAFCGGSAVVLNGEMHILGSSLSDAEKKYHYKWDGSSWRKVSTLPYAFNYSSAAVLNGEIHILGAYAAAYGKNHYKWDGSSWTQVSTLPYEFCCGSTAVLNGEIHILGGGNTSIKRTSHYYYYVAKTTDQSVGSKIAIYQNPSNTSGTYATNFISGVPITGENNKFPSGFDDVYYIDDSGNVEESPTYYGDGTQWIKFKN